MTKTMSKATPTATVVRDDRITIEEQLLLNDVPEPGWSVIGTVRNTSNETLGDVVIEVTLFDTTDEPVESVTTHPIVSPLLPGELSPFIATFPPTTDVVYGDVHILGAEAVVNDNIEVIVDEGSPSLSSSGKLEILGMIKNQSYDHAIIEEAGVVLRDDLDALVNYLPIQVRDSHLEPRGSVPFKYAYDPQYMDASREIYLRISEISKPTPSGVLIEGEPIIYKTAQGTPFLLGTLNNTTSRAQIPYVLILVEIEDELIDLFELRAPVPLAPNEMRPFSASLEEIDPINDPNSGEENVVVRWYVDPVASHDQANLPGTLDLEISQVETIGSSMYYRGTISNPYDQTLLNPTIFGTLRDLEGKTISAGWSQIGQELPPGEGLDFSLGLLLPAGVNSADLEIDMRALGVVSLD